MELIILSEQYYFSKIKNWHTVITENHECIEAINMYLYPSFYIYIRENFTLFHDYQLQMFFVLYSEG